MCSVNAQNGTPSKETRGNVSLPSRRDSPQLLGLTCLITNHTGQRETLVLSPLAVILGQLHRDGGGKGHTRNLQQHVRPARPLAGVWGETQPEGCCVSHHALTSRARPPCTWDPLKPEEAVTAQPGTWNRVCVREQPATGREGPGQTSFGVTDTTYP